VRYRSILREIYTVFTEHLMKSLLFPTLLCTAILVLAGCSSPNSGNATSVSGSDFGMASLISSDVPVRDIASTIEVTTPTANMLFANGDPISGKAKGWTVDGKFTIKILDEQGDILYQEAANTSAPDHEGFEAFALHPVFTAGSKHRGKIVLERNVQDTTVRESMEIPVIFSE